MIYSWAGRREHVPHRWSLRRVLGKLEIYLFLLDCQGQRFQLGVFGFEHLGVEAVVVLLGVR
jgi:hypothetical protein